jgi:hypothetical protein
MKDKKTSPDAKAPARPGEERGMPGENKRKARLASLFYIVWCLCLLPLPVFCASEQAHNGGAGKMACPCGSGMSTGSARVSYDGTAWKVKGEGVVCCPCAVPCPCRVNAAPSYGHCEATLYLRIAQGNYGNVKLDGMQVIDTGGMCAIHYQNLSALYFDPSSSSAQRLAFMKIVASFSGYQPAEFAHVRVMPFNSEVIGDHFFKVTIPGTVAIIVDRNWGEATPPMPLVAAPDFFSNVLQYAQNIRYWMHDPEAGLDFDYSRRQANYRKVDITDQQYRSRSMLIQFGTGKGWYSPDQMRLIKAQHLTIPNIEAVQKQALRLRQRNLASDAHAP